VSNEPAPDQNNDVTYLPIRSPRAAAIAGIIFSLLMVASMILASIAVPATLADIIDIIGEEWLETAVDITSLVLGLVPFAGIAFLWFTAVIIDRTGQRRDRFFTAIFYGSGILFLAMMFVWAAIAGAIIRSYAFAANTLIDKNVYIFGLLFMDEIFGNYALRMAGVYMLSIGTLWSRTGVMPRWLIIITTIVALGFLLFADIIREARYIFPAWVFLVSVYILITNRRDGR